MGGPIFLGAWLETGNAFDSGGKNDAADQRQRAA